MASIDTLVCPTDCTALLPTVSFNECAPTYLTSQVSDVYLMNSGYPLTNWTNADELLTRISNDSTDSNAIRAFAVVGSVAAPTQTEKKTSHRRTAYSDKEFTLSATIDDNSDTNYDAARAAGCNRSYRFLYGTLGNKLYGGNTGILSTLRMWEEITDSDDDFAVLKMEFKWKAKLMPLRTDNPLTAY